ncbi:bifunctional hydroxymethylpyrimidine kinase/phosphomethylpyrimidine kinase [Candidatus Bathyarchaeota archaeon]|nr:bifunctional hydroxymethylpyrimidine kinase/phosphomethylpyrimidine kinase [Candidatus Bathyarchaeota archaeon]
MSLQATPRALTIAGSDSGGGAGVQADLKTFAALGVHGMSALTSVTAQNTLGVKAVHDVPPGIVKAQIEAVVEDIGVDAAKTGMLHTPSIIEAVAEEIDRYRLPTVVDPVMVAKSGAVLLQPEAVEILKSKLLPVARVVTPNAPEAEALSGLKIGSIDDAAAAAKRIADLGPGAVVVKGGHIQGSSVVDLLYLDGSVRRFEAERVASSATHGTGCSFSAAIAAEISKGKEIVEAVSCAKMLVTDAIRFGLNLGKGHGPVNPLASLYMGAERFWVIENITEAVSALESDPRFHQLVPESQTNLVMALSYASGPEHVAAVPGRIVKLGERVRASAPPRFGASRHVAATVLTARRYDPEIRAAMNIRFSEKILEACCRLGLGLSSYDRRQEPDEVKSTEGRSTGWGAEVAIKAAGRVPEVIYHRGDWGKEPMMTILGRSAVEVVEMARRIAAELEKV